MPGGSPRQCFVFNGRSFYRVLIMKFPNCLTMLLLMLGLLGGCTGGRYVSMEEATTEGDGQYYIIGPGDSVQIFVWGKPELSTTVPVRPDGNVTVPLVEDLAASGKTSSQLARDLESNLSKYIKNPIVTVTVTQFVGRYSEQIRVVGEASEPKMIPYKEDMSLLDVMIEVGGLTEYAAGNRASIVRKATGKQKQFRVYLDDLLKDGDISKNVDMYPGDILIIPESWF